MVQLSHDAEAVERQIAENRLVTAARDGTIRVWAIDPDDLVAQATERVGRPLD